MPATASMTTSLIIKFHKLVIKRKVQQRKLLAGRYKTSAGGARKDEHRDQQRDPPYSQASWRLEAASWEISTPPDRAHPVQHRGSRRAGLTLTPPTRASRLAPNRKRQDDDVESGRKKSVSAEGRELKPKPDSLLLL